MNNFGVHVAYHIIVLNKATQIKHSVLGATRLHAGGCSSDWRLVSAGVTPPHSLPPSGEWENHGAPWFPWSLGPVVVVSLHHFGRAAANPQNIQQTDVQI